MWGTPAAGAKPCRRPMELGARIHYHGADIHAVRAAPADIRRGFGPLVVEFDDLLARPGRGDPGQPRAPAEAHECRDAGPRVRPGGRWDARGDPTPPADRQGSRGNRAGASDHPTEA